MIRSYADLALQSPYYDIQEISAHNSETLTMKLVTDEFKVDNVTLGGKVILMVLHDPEYKYGEYEYDIQDVFDISDLEVITEHGDLIPLHYLSVQPTHQQIVDALNEGMNTWHKYLREVPNPQETK